MTQLLRPRDLKPLFKWSKDGVHLLHPRQHINLEKLDYYEALELLDELLEQEITKYQRKDIKEVKDYLITKKQN